MVSLLKLSYLAPGWSEWNAPLSRARQESVERVERTVGRAAGNRACAWLLLGRERAVGRAAG